MQAYTIFMRILHTGIYIMLWFGEKIESQKRGGGREMIRMHKIYN